MDKAQRNYPVGAILRLGLEGISFKVGQPHIDLKEGKNSGVVVGPEDQPGDCDGSVKEFAPNGLEIGKEPDFGPEMGEEAAVEPSMG